jgi:glycosyltransferase 2 family protein
VIQPRLFQRIRRNMLTWAPGVLISVVALVMVFRLTNWQDLRQSITSIHPMSLFQVVIVSIIALMVRASAWWILLNRKVSVWHTFNILNIGYLMNNLLPLRAGEISRVILMGKVSGKSSFHVLPTLVVERVFDLVISAGMLVITIPFVIGMEWAKQIGLIVLALAFFGFIVLYFLAQHSKQVESGLAKILPSWSFFHKWISPRLAAMLDGLEVMRHPAQFFLSALLMLLCWGLYIVSYGVVILPLVPDFPLWGLPFILSVVALGMAVPSAPAGIGVYEAALVGSLLLFDVPSSTALALALTLHMLSFILYLGLGINGLAVEGRSLTSLFVEAQSKILSAKSKKVV